MSDVNRRRESGPSTRAVHAGEERQRTAVSSLTTPLYQTATYTFAEEREVRAYQEGQLVRDEYGRYGNPTARAAEGKIAELEGGGEAILFASGMCALTTLLLTWLPRGAHIVVSTECYRRTQQFVREILAKLDVTASAVDPSDLGQLAQALRPETRLFFTESPTNPHLRVIDLPAAAQLCHERGVLVAVDATFATPINQRPLEQGADVALHSATKYLGGHNDLLAGVAVTDAERAPALRQAVGILGGVLDPHAAYLLLRGLKTLSLRMERHNQNGHRLAQWLADHPAVRRVWYPGLPSHPDFATARRLMTGWGGVVSFELAADFDATERFLDACRIPRLGPSFGGVESLIERPATMSYWDLAPEARQRLGIGDSLVRLSAGVEDIEDLLADLDTALRAL